MDLRLAGKVVLVTGASRGIGLATAQAFAREGARIGIVARRVEPLEDARKTIARQDGADKVLAVQGDMSVEKDVRHVFGALEEKFGAIDAVVANVGGGTSQSGFDIGRAEWDRVMALNLHSATTVATEALRRAAARGRGSLTFVSSIAGIEALGAPIAYSAAKAALQIAMKLYAQQVGSKGVRVNAVAPGNILFPGGTWEGKLSERREQIERYIQEEVAMGRFGRPEEIADTVVFLASERSSFTTGALWVVDGGQTRGL